MPWASSPASHDKPVRVTSPGEGQSAVTPTVTREQIPGPWCRRRSVLLGVCVAVILAITVITDLPSPASRATDSASATAVIKEVNDDISPCVFAAGEAFTIYADQAHNSLTVSDRARV